MEISNFKAKGLKVQFRENHMIFVSAYKNSKLIETARPGGEVRDACVNFSCNFFVSSNIQQM